jgi:hypothetical protein
MAGIPSPVDTRSGVNRSICLMLRRRRRFAVRYSSLSLVREALPQQSR